ncbi:MAG: GTP-binding protein, partial [Oscillospiraceae bacterium]|nr:GTP-binding protein [Oscillospiraceae bacterium]
MTIANNGAASGLQTAENIRNIAIIAHVDHGKTTLVDSMFRQSGIYRSNEQAPDRAMDSNEIERERGITILSKNASVVYRGVKINIVDTPGHADFGGEVERVLKMVNGVLLLVDAFEGPMPQTRFVLRKALELALSPIVVINKADRPDARTAEVIDEVLGLFIELGADGPQLEFPIIYASARDGWAELDDILSSGAGAGNVAEASGAGVAGTPGAGAAEASGAGATGAEDSAATEPAGRDGSKEGMVPLFETIINAVPPPSGRPDMPLQALISNIDYDDYVGRVAIGRIERGFAFRSQPVAVCGKTTHNEKINRLYTFEGQKRVETERADFGDIVAVAGTGGRGIRATTCCGRGPRPRCLVHI